MDLRPLQPYVEEQAKLALGGGLFSVRGHAVYSSEKGSPMAVFQGDLGLTNFSTTDLIQFKDFVKWDSVAVNGIQAAFQPNSLKVQEVKLSGLSTSIILQTNQQLNLLAVLPPKPAGASAAPPAAPGPSISPTSPSSRTVSLTCRNSAAPSRACPRIRTPAPTWISRARWTMFPPFP
jgi:hypothetical protein